MTPQLRFSEFSDKWNYIKYNDIFSFYTTNSFSRDKLNYKKGKVKNIHYGDIHTKFSVLFDINKELVPFINEDVDISKIKQGNYCKEGDLVIADASEDYNDVGKTIEIVNLGKDIVIAGLHTFLARPKKNMVALGFTGYLLQSWNVRKQVMTIAQGSKVLGLSYNRLGEINLTISSIPEQQKIASFLTAVDTKITQLKHKKELLAQYKKGVMQQIFNQEICFKDDEGNEYPKWKVKLLGDICEINKGKQLNTEFLTKKGLYPCISGGINPSGYTKDYNRIENTITISEGGNSCGFVNFFTTKFWCGGHCYAIENLKNDIVGNNFLYQILKYREIKIMRLRVGSGLPNIQKKDIHKFKIVIPNSIEEQTKIANFLSAIDTKIKYVDTQLEKTKTFKKGLLQQLFV